MADQRNTHAPRNRDPNRIPNNRGPSTHEIRIQTRHNLEVRKMNLRTWSKPFKVRELREAKDKKQFMLSTIKQLEVEE